MPQNNARKMPRRKRNNPRRKPQVSFPRGPSFVTDARPYRFTKLIDKGAVTSTSAAEGNYAFQFTLNDISEVSSFTSVFDQYRISRIDVLLKPCTQVSTNATTAPPYAFCYVVTDYDDAGTLATASLALNYQNVSILGPGQGHRRVLIPHCNIALASSGTQTSLSKPAPWLDCADPNVIHYALKISITQSTSTLVSTWRLFTRYFIEFRMVR